MTAVVKESSVTPGVWEVAERYAYEAYGKTTVLDASRNPTNADPIQPYGFTGRRMDFEEGSGLYFYRLRYYDPEAGRFISRDPLGWAGSPEGNLQNYCLNNPVNLIDPFGQNPDGAVYPADFVGPIPDGCERGPCFELPKEHRSLLDPPKPHECTSACETIGGVCYDRIMPFGETLANAIGGTVLDLLPFIGTKRSLDRYEQALLTQQLSTPSSPMEQFQIDMAVPLAACDYSVGMAGDGLIVTGVLVRGLGALLRGFGRAARALAMLTGRRRADRVVFGSAGWVEGSRAGERAAYRAFAGDTGATYWFSHGGVTDAGQVYMRWPRKLAGNLPAAMTAELGGQASDPLVMVVCRIGKDPDFCQTLANRLGRPIWVNSTDTIAFEGGILRAEGPNMFVIEDLSDTARWLRFDPGGKGPTADVPFWVFASPAGP